jgi:hypothetical protein
MSLPSSQARYTNPQRLTDGEIAKILEENGKDYHPDYLRARIIDEQEELHFKILRRNFVLLWGIFGNLLIFTIEILSAVLNIKSIARFEWALIGGLVISILVSIVLLYTQYKAIRATRIRIRKLNVALRRNRQLLESPSDGDEENRLLQEHKRYRDDLPDVITGLKEEANRYRRWANYFQAVIIIGSVATSAITTASVSYQQVRWVAVGVSAVAGLAAGFIGYFKYRERSYHSQHSADSIEREYESVELRVGRYEGMSEKKAYASFCAYVEYLRDEQAKRQQQLDQPADVKREQSAQA